MKDNLSTLHYIPLHEITRLLSLPCSARARTALFAAACRINTLYMIASAGSGHIGSSFSSLDIVSWLFLQELGDEGVYFSSKGHDVPGLYSVLLGLGRLPFEKIHALRRLGGLPGHPNIATVPQMVTNTGSLGMGISKAKGMALANRLNGQRKPIYVLTGDGELQEGQIWESLQGGVNCQLDEITVIVDHNKLQSDTLVSKTSDLGDLEKKFASFGWHVARCDGHDLDQLAAVFAEFRTVRGRPKVLIADTVKGRGVSFMEHTSMDSDVALYRFHSGAPDYAVYEKAVAEMLANANEKLASLGAVPLRTESAPAPRRPSVEGFQRLVGAYSKALVAQAEKEKSLVVLDADLLLDTGLIPYKEKFPDRFFECGIAEQDMVSMAGGMALRGLLPIVHSFACFLSTRPNEQIYNNASEGTKIIYVGSLAGLLPGTPGHSHQSVRDISAVAATPGLIALEPSCEAEVALALDYCVSRARESCYLRLVSLPCEIPFQLPAHYQLEVGHGVTLAEGTDLLVFGYGPILLAQACKAAAALQASGAPSVKIVNLPWLNRLDSAWLAETVRGFSRVVTLDNHYVAGGQGQMIAARLAGLGLPLRVWNLGVHDFPLCGQHEEVLKAHRLDAASLAEEFTAILASGKA
jgi:transketolase